MSDKFMDELANCILPPFTWQCLLLHWQITFASPDWRLYLCYRCRTVIGGGGLACRPYMTLSQFLRQRTREEMNSSAHCCFQRRLSLHPSPPLPSPSFCKFLQQTAALVAAPDAVEREHPDRPPPKKISFWRRDYLVN